MNVSLKYQTYNRGRPTSYGSNNMGDIKSPLISYTGVLESNLVFENVRHFWINSDFEVDLFIVSDDGSVTEMSGVMLFTTEFNKPASMISIRKSSWVEDDSITVDIQAFATSSYTRNSEST